MFGQCLCRILALVLIISHVNNASAGMGLSLPINIPFLSLYQQPDPYQHHEHYPVKREHQKQSQDHLLDHAHRDEAGRYYLHDPDSSVKFYFEEYLTGPSKHVDVYDDGCKEVPMDYWHNKPRSLWAKHCISLYKDGNCNGEGVKVAGTVSDFRSIKMYYGISSFKPCEKNIRIRFLPTVKHQNHHHH